MPRSGPTSVNKASIVAGPSTASPVEETPFPFMADNNYRYAPTSPIPTDGDESMDTVYVMRRTAMRRMILVATLTPWTTLQPAPRSHPVDDSEPGGQV